MATWEYNWELSVLVPCMQMQLDNVEAAHVVMCMSHKCIVLCMSYCARHSVHVMVCMPIYACHSVHECHSMHVMVCMLYYACHRVCITL